MPQWQGFRVFMDTSLDKSHLIVGADDYVKSFSLSLINGIDLIIGINHESGLARPKCFWVAFSSKTKPS